MPDFQVEVGSLRRSELDEVIASQRHVAPSLLRNQLSVNLSCFSWPSGEEKNLVISLPGDCKAPFIIPEACSLPVPLPLLKICPAVP